MLITFLLGALDRVAAAATAGRALGRRGANRIYLYNTIPYYDTILHYTMILYYSILHYTTLYYAITI